MRTNAAKFLFRIEDELFVFEVQGVLRRAVVQETLFLSLEDALESLALRYYLLRYAL